MSDGPAQLLEMSGIAKRFPGVIALQGVSLSLAAGEVLALVGENGAGKSTLMKILGGALQPDEGSIAIDGRTVRLRSVRAAKQNGVALIHQELMLAANLDIAANIFLGNERRAGGMLGLLPRQDLNTRAEQLLRRVGLRRKPTTPVSTLTAGQMQMVEIAKALSMNARIIIMDEPTSSLTSSESEQLFAIIRRLQTEGIGIIYISHRLEEVLALSDRITVLRDGRCVGEIDRDEASVDKMVGMMVGRELSGRYFPEARQRAGKPLLVVSELLVPGARTSVSFTARAGEILGFAGLVGSGRTELMQSIFGVSPAISGTMSLSGERFSPRSARDAIDRGVVLAPEDRKRHGLVLSMSIAQNTSLPNIASYSRWGWLNRRAEARVAHTEMVRLRTKAPSIRQRTVNLSGGNQQKVVLGKWLAMQPRVLILDEPTRGIDVGAKAEIYRHMAVLADQGITILMVSSDMVEIIGMSDRVTVMHERRLVGVIPKEDLTESRIASLMAGHTSRGGALP